MTNITMETPLSLQQYQEAVNTHLETVLTPPNDIAPAHLYDAMRYAVFNGGKRLRPALTYATGLDLGSTVTQLNPPATAIELIHCYSLVHDDLPAMDDDDLRRGQPSCHKAFDEATAILAGNALQSLAFEVLATQTQQGPTITLTMIEQLAKLGGAEGMGGGQVLDLAAEKVRPTLEQLETIHELKTAALIRASILLGAYSAGLQDSQQLSTLARLATQLGLAFQIQDDILDLTASTTTLGKHAGSDIKQNKATYPLLCDMATSRDKAASLFASCLQQLDLLPYPMERLQQLIIQLQNRQH